MLPEIGHFALILALMATVLQVVLPSVGLWRGDFAFTQLSKPLLWMQFFWVLVSFALLMNAFLVDDFLVLLACKGVDCDNALYKHVLLF
jgi:cytochrome c-type biogenesis protein CcmF